MAGRTEKLLPARPVSVTVAWDTFNICRFVVITLWLVSLLISSCLTSSEAHNPESDSVLNSKALPDRPLRTIIVPDYYPYTFVNDHGKSDGFAVDLAKAVVRAMDMKLTISADTWEHAREALQNGTIDFLPMMAFSPVRKESFDFSAPHTIAYDAVFVRKGARRITSVDDLAGKSVIVLNRDQAHDYLLTTSVSNKIKLILVDSLPDGPRMLASGKGDAALMPKLVGLLLVKKLGIQNVDESPGTVEAYSRPFCFAVKKGNSALLERLSQGLSIVKADGRYRAIHDKWFGVLAPPGLPWKTALKYLAGIVAAFALVGMALLVWSLSLKRMVKQRTMTLEAQISERKKAEEALRASEERYRGVFQNAAVGIDLVDANGRFLQINSSLAEMLGYTEDELLSLTFFDVSHPDDIESSRIKHEKMLQEETESYRFEKRYIRKNGEVFWADVSVSPVHGPDGVHVATVGVIADITDRKRSEEAMRASEQMLRTILSTSPVGIAHTRNRRIEWFNEACRQMFGIENDHEYLGQDVKTFYLSDEEYERTGQDLYQYLHLGEVGETDTKVRRKDGSVFDANVKMKALDPLDLSKGVICVISDISPRKRAQEVQRRLATAIEQSAEAVVITNAEAVIQYVNPATERITGFDRSEIIGNTPRIFKSGEHDKAFYEKLWNTITGGMVWSGRIINKRKDGTIYQEDATISPVRDASGKIVNFVAVKRDVTKHLQLTRQLFQAQKMEAVGTLAGGIAHDFNNILQVILGYSELVLSDEELPDRWRGDIDKILLAGQNGADLVQRLLTFSRKTEPKPLDLDLNQRIRQTHKLLQRTLPKMIDIELLLAEDLAGVHADPTLLDQVLMNLAVNARDAMPEGGKLVIETANVNLDEEYVRTHHGARAGQYALLRMSDTGLGMSRETVEHIFEPFYTTKEAGKGTGLGLAMVYGIVKQHDGYITCYSEPGQGTVFNIYLPALESGGVFYEGRAVEIPPGGSETILFVDDEDHIRDIGSRMLRKAGYRVIQASDGIKALEVYRQSGDEISLVILDLIMPKMGGRECLDNLLKLNPSIKVVIASGFSADGRTKEVLAAGAKGFVNKPYDIRQVLQVVREVLDAV